MMKLSALDEEQIVGAYRFREDAFFYRGHFPGRPITPGVILIETMAQIGVVAFGMYLLACQKNVTTEPDEKSFKFVFPHRQRGV